MLVMPLYVELYDIACPEVRPDIDAAHDYTVRRLREQDLEVVTWSVCRLAEEFSAAIAADKAALDNSVEDLNETNRLLFPDNRVISVLYGRPIVTIDLKTSFPALYLTHPSQSAESVERVMLLNPCFKGLKVYLEFAPDYIPANEIRIYDFVTREQLALADKYSWLVQIHIARPKRLPA